jgi:transposase
MDVVPPDLADDVEGARKSGHTSARMGRVEVLASADRRRSWTLEQKREIVSESLGPELTPAEVARKYRIGTGQLYTWRQQLLAVQGKMLTATPQFAAVEVAPPPLVPPDPMLVESRVPIVPPVTRTDGLIEIQLASGVLLRVDAHVDGRALRRVLGALSDR